MIPHIVDTATKRSISPVAKSITIVILLLNTTFYHAIPCPPLGCPWASAWSFPCFRLGNLCFHNSFLLFQPQIFFRFGRWDWCYPFQIWCKITNCVRTQQTFLPLFYHSLYYLDISQWTIRFWIFSYGHIILLAFSPHGFSLFFFMFPILSFHARESGM